MILAGHVAERWFPLNSPITTACAVVAAVVSVHAFVLATFTDRPRRRYTPIAAVFAVLTLYFAVLRSLLFAEVISEGTYRDWTLPWLGLVYLGLAAYPAVLTKEIQARRQRARRVDDTVKGGG